MQPCGARSSLSTVMGGSAVGALLAASWFQRMEPSCCALARAARQQQDPADPGSGQPFVDRRAVELPDAEMTNGARVALGDNPHGRTFAFHRDMPHRHRAAEIEGAPARLDSTEKADKGEAIIPRCS